MKNIKKIVECIKVISAMMVATILNINKNNKDIWVISEREDEAEDNGYHLYKYIKENQKDQKIFYFIDKKANSYERIKKYDTVIQYNSFKHYLYYFLASKHISAFQCFGVPGNGVLWRLESWGVITPKRIFIQHGITRDELPFLKYNSTHYRLFICGAKKEYEYVRDNFDYPKEFVRYTGLARFDNLHEIETKNKVLLMPTWRKWLGMTKSYNTKTVEEDCSDFLKSDYYKEYQSLVNNKKLIKIMKENNMELLFYPHPEMQRFRHLFDVDNDVVRIIRREETNLQDILKEVKMVITDYSSISFDAAYMKKPLIYYQFDQSKYHKNHFAKGYFDAERDGFGPVIYKQKELIEYISKIIGNEKIEEEYYNRASDFFQLHDKNNCCRIYKEIKGC